MYLVVEMLFPLKRPPCAAVAADCVWEQPISAAARHARRARQLHTHVIEQHGAAGRLFVRSSSHWALGGCWGDARFVSTAAVLSTSRSRRRAAQRADNGWASAQPECRRRGACVRGGLKLGSQCA